MQADPFILALGAMGFGMWLLIRGGDWTVDGAVWVARRFGIPPMVIGFTIIAFGTSLPELLVSITASLQGSPGLALGNVIGSNIANVLLIIGAAAVITPVVACKFKCRPDMMAMVGSTVLLMVLLQLEVISRPIGIAMVVALVLYVLWQYRQAMRGEIEAEEIDEDATEFASLGRAVLVTIGGLIAVAAGAKFLVDGAVTVALRLGMSEAVIGLTVVAFGTSLPELATAIAAAIKKQTEMLVGNVVGSNVFNILCILGITSIVKPMPIVDAIAMTDAYVVGLSALLLAGVMVTVGRFNRVAGSGMLAAYAAYVVFLYLRSEGMV
ncbi:MAG: calcium/sodium antiporter [Alphaproteobacteria bacterium]